MNQRICIITSGHLANSPRLFKAADALHQAGYKVRMVCAEHVDWAMAAGDRMRAQRPWRCDVVDWHSRTGKLLYWKSRLRHKLARVLAARLGPERLGLSLLNIATTRVGPELVQTAIAEPADFFYSGSAGGIALAALAAEACNTPFGMDLEDFYSEEHPDSPAASRAHAVTEGIERRVLGRAQFLTAGSAPIAEAYEAKYGVKALPINNVFPLPRQAPAPRSWAAPLRLFWFSQSVASGRGLEDAISAAGLLDRPVWLKLLGFRSDVYSNHLRQLASQVAPLLTLEFVGTKAPEEIVETARWADVGLALEIGEPRNRQLCLTNKIFTYMLAGLAVAATDTIGQRILVEDLAEGGFLYQSGDVKGLAAGLKYWADNPDALLRAKQQSWSAVQRRWHWEHPLECGALLDAFARVFERKSGHGSNTGSKPVGRVY